MVSHYSPDQQMPVTHLDSQLCISKDKEEEGNIIFNDNGFELL